MNSLFTETQHDVVSAAIWHAFKSYRIPLSEKGPITTALDFFQQLEGLAKTNQAARVLYCLMPTRLSNAEANDVKEATSDNAATRKVESLIHNKLKTYFSDLPLIAFRGINDTTAAEIEKAELRSSLLDWTNTRVPDMVHTPLLEHTQKIVAAFANSLATFNAQQQLQHSRC